MEFRAFKIRIKKENVQDYIDVHKKDNIWKDLVINFKKIGYKKIILIQIGQDIIVFEEALNLKKVYQSTYTDETSKKWESKISEMMEEYLSFNETKEDIEFKELPVVFYYENGKLKH